MAQNDIHRSYVLSPLETGKIKDTGWFHVSLPVFVQGYDWKFFFACSGNGNGTTWNNRGSNGNYWSSSFNSARNARNLNFNSGGVNPQNNNNRYNGRAVRAVQHTILTILLLLIYGTYTSAAAVRPLSGLLQCKEAQVKSLLCQVMGEEPEAEHGGLVRRFVHQTLQADAFEVLHSRLSEEEGDIRCGIQRPCSTPSVFQLYARTLREDAYSGLIQLHQRPWHALRHRAHKGFLPQGEQELAEAMLCDALGYQRLLHAHHKAASAGDIHRLAEEDGIAPNQQGLGKDMGRCYGYGFHDMADGGHSHAEPQTGLYYLRLKGRLERSGPSEVDAQSGGRHRTADRQSHLAAVLECLSERVRPVHEANHEVQILWSLCGRCGCNQLRQGMASGPCPSYQGVHEIGAWAGPSHGKAGDFGGASWSGVPWSIHKAVQDLYLEPCAGEDEGEDISAQLQESASCAEKRKFLSGHIPSHLIIQSEQEAPYDEGYPKNRCFSRGYDKDKRQVIIL